MKSKQKQRRLGRDEILGGNIPSVVMRLFLPNIIGMLGMVLYNIVDTYFVGQLGIIELAAISFTFPVVMTVGMLSVGLGTATMTLFARAVGSQDLAREKELASTALIVALITSLIISTAGWLTIDPVFRMLGADEKLMPLIKSYMNIYYLGAIFVVIPMTGDHIMRGLGDTMTPSLVMLSAVIINLILDPILIFGIGPIPSMGIRGAAIATVFARMITLLISISVLHFRDKLLDFKTLKLKTFLKDYKNLFILGLPNSAIKVIIPLGTSVFTFLLAGFGHETVAGYGVAAKMEGIVISICGAISVSATVFIGQNLGAGHTNRVKQGIKWLYILALTWGVFSGIVLFFAGSWFGSFFNDDTIIRENIARYFRIISISYSLFCISQIGFAILNAYHKPFKAASISIIQMFIIAVPLSFLLSSKLGAEGVYMAMALSYFLSGLLAMLVVRNENKTTGAQINE